MSESYNALTVTLDHNVHETDIEHVLNAVRMIKGVQSVVPHVADFETHVAQERARRELGEKLLAVIYPRSGS